MPRIDVLTLFPRMLDGFLSESIVGKARAAGLIDLKVRDLRDWATDKHRTADDRPFGKPNWRSPNWADHMPSQANYRCLGVAELASAVLRGTPHRSSGALASHALEVMHAILKAGVEGGEIAVRSRVERPAPLSDVDAMALWGEEAF